MNNSDNPQRGAAFELLVQDWLGKKDIDTKRNFSVHVGAASDRRPHKFDLGCDDPPRLVECKRHTWTSGGKPRLNGSFRSFLMIVYQRPSGTADRLDCEFEKNGQIVENRWSWARK